jgi:hypothetical protein
LIDLVKGLVLDLYGLSCCYVDGLLEKEIEGSGYSRFSFVGVFGEFGIIDMDGFVI